MSSAVKKRVRGLALASFFLLPVLSVVTTQFAVAASPSPATPSLSPSAQPSHSPNPVHTHGIMEGPTALQKSAIAAAKITYQASVQSALNGANKAIADARSIRDQALAAAGKDANVRRLANSDFMSSSSQIWSAFKVSVAAAKSAFDTQIASIKNGALQANK